MKNKIVNEKKIFEVFGIDTKYRYQLYYVLAEKKDDIKRSDDFF